MPIAAKLVFDGGTVQIPEYLGTPRANQLQGTEAEKLCELAGRTCYDSLGKGRSSEEYHKHILEVGHTSTLEHFNFTVFFGNILYQELATSCVNRKGVYVKRNGFHSADVSLNLRSALEWDRYSTEDNESHIKEFVSKEIKSHANRWAPSIIYIDYENTTNFDINKLDDPKVYTKDQAFVSMYLSGSRGWSHEQVRHRYAMSQRSTRYVDESESEWIEHPLITEYKKRRQLSLCYDIKSVKEVACKQYQYSSQELESFLINQGIDKTSARKQARGAARGYLGNSLATEMIFTAPVSGWLDMMRQRCSRFADAEIRELYCLVLPELKRSRYGFFFDKMNLIPSPDGIGQVLEESP